MFNYNWKNGLCGEGSNIWDGTRRCRTEQVEEDKISRLKKKLGINECFVDDGCHLGNG